MCYGVTAKLKAILKKKPFQSEADLPKCQGSVIKNFDHYTRDFEHIDMSEVPSMINSYELAKSWKGGFAKTNTQKIPKNITTAQAAFDTGLFTLNQISRGFGREGSESCKKPSKIIDQLSGLSGPGVYLFKWHDGGPIFYKIGRTGNLYSRMMEWKRSMPDPDCVEFLRLCKVPDKPDPYCWQHDGSHRFMKNERDKDSVMQYYSLGELEREILLACRYFLTVGEWVRDDIGRHRKFLNALEDECENTFIGLDK